jgi:hypothetical protein
MENRTLRGFGTRDVCMQSMVEIADRHIADEERVDSGQTVLTPLSAEDLSVRRASSAERKKALQKMGRENAEMNSRCAVHVTQRISAHAGGHCYRVCTFASQIKSQSHKAAQST